MYTAHGYIIREFDTEEDSIPGTEKQKVVRTVLLCVRLYNIFLRPIGDLLHTMTINL